MKHFFSALLLMSVFIACKKNSTDPPPKPEISKDSLLVRNVWQVQKIHVLQNNVLLFYERGGSNNDYNYDNDYLKFEKDGSGTYSTGTITYNLTWKFDNVAKTEMSYVLRDYANGGPSPGSYMDIRLENVFLDERSFIYSELYTNANGTHAICSVYRQPKP